MAPTARASLLAGALLALGACGCGSGSAPEAATPHSGLTVGSGGTAHVVMQSLFFSPVQVRAQVGARVVWTNDDAAPHNVTYVSGPRFTSSRTMLRRGQRFSIRVTQPGTIHYYCTLHPWMKATIVVSQ